MQEQGKWKAIKAMTPHNQVDHSGSTLSGVGMSEEKANWEIEKTVMRNETSLRVGQIAGYDRASQLSVQ